ncbi:MAG: tetratricopeptide repeat protein [Chroococcidiopsidaceae cyanobacterium CP_BM_RX_35]|nr:tetratricopeptide repeat protein [Chroococcidiopsidaceae cyanobacterium CP_BM_RX_35]
MQTHLKNSPRKKQRLLAVSIPLLVGLAITLPLVAQAQEVVAPDKDQPASSPSQTNPQQLNALLEEGRRLVDAGDFSDAIALYQQAATLDRTNPEIYSGIGYLQDRQRNYSAAVAAYQQAVALAPKNSQYQYALGYSLANSGDNVGAAAAYRQAVQLNRKDVNAYLGLGVVLFRQGKYTEAMQADKKAISIAPKFARAYELKGAILQQQGHAKEAIAALSHARDLYQHQGYTAGVQRAEAMLKEFRQ